MQWAFAPLRPFSYDLIMVDPPWPTKMRSPRGEYKSAAGKYGLMSFDDIAKLPVGQLATRDAILFLWCTWPLLFHGGDPARHFADADASVTPIGRIIKAWGARYVTGGAWFKRTITGKPAFGTGYVLRSACEPFLIAKFGQPVTTRKERNAFDGLAREHSRKPDEAFAMCERWMPGARRVELFSRQSRPGWDSWGLEAGIFDPVVHENATPAPLPAGVAPMWGAA